MKIKFLGTNGWFSTATGGTTCAAVVLSDRLIVLDAGEGLYKVPKVAKEGGISKTDIFISHLHLDHTIGLHTLPLFRKGCTVRLLVHKSYVKSLHTLLNHPYTASASQLWAKLDIVPLKQGPNLLPYKVTVLPLRHADPSWGFRFEFDGKTIAYCADTGPCENLARLADKADAFITECALQPGAPELRGWPHLSPEMAAMAAKKAAAKRLVLTHFDAVRYKTLQARLAAEKAAKKIFNSSQAAYDGFVVSI